MLGNCEKRGCLGNSVTVASVDFEYLKGPIAVLSPHLTDM